MAATKPARAGSIEQLLAAKEIVVCCGSGGVGKTTTAAALAAMAATRHGGRVLVVTVDPARRLANALGLEGFGNVETRVPDSAFEASNVKPRGELWAAMLDTRQSWDDLVHMHAPNPATEQAILDNKLYQNFAGRFVQSHDYIAMERLYEIHSSGTYDLVVVDTPPTRNAVDFLDAPERMEDFFTSRFLRLLIAPYKSRLVSMASKPFYQVADRILGTQFLQDIAEFFILFQSMYDGFVNRARAVSALLRDKRTTFVVVSTLEAAPLHEAEFFLDQLDERTLHLGAIVLNKVLPAYFLDDASARVAERITHSVKEVADAVATPEEDAADVARVLTEVAESYLRFAVVAQREAEQRAELAASPEVVASVPFFESDIADLGGLLRLGSKIWS